MSQLDARLETARAALLDAATEVASLVGLVTQDAARCHGEAAALWVLYDANNEWQEAQLQAYAPEEAEGLVGEVYELRAPQTHLWCEDGRTNRCFSDPLGDHHTYRPDEVTCLACRALHAEDREDAKGSALVTAQRALRETQAERDALQLVGRKLRMELFNALAKTRELDSVCAFLKGAEQRAAVLAGQKARILEALRVALAAMQANIAYATRKDEPALVRGIESALAAIAAAEVKA